MPDTPSEASPEVLVAAFWETLFARDWERLHVFFGDDSLYWDVPAGPTLAAKGAKGIVARAKSVLDSLAAFENDHLRRAVEGDTVMTEHHEIWRFASGEEIVLPCLSVQVVHDGVITLWKDYWDMQALMAQAPAAWREGLAGGDFSWIFDASGIR
ncbi:nuclear transport factor 2 family protein [Frankia sp. CNm7]|uniref:Nuclear transport factor 2 family protein n=1 Tax=Frankia nepalensis TaxID=1836974 RepID=A0A937UP84_9ACTN|nr:limonene-1,2-epoxide hydrolase family protein [Frankia nepalensis]MBL7500870.1 nuclear transport factor 2 family protein [Frankia nepalensis]MBL7509236.1 nuclear transport factor 2 family protein [Frankia nepalensis]MBL7517305.1 nuclear transport factor 2 family protein [Frankia nepalensis]MBL7627000.1 nuclear transport factor 2 family protein [Frankia nepalensis]